LEENGIGDTAVGDEGDDCLSSEDPRSSPDVVFSKVASLDLIRGISLFCGVVCLRYPCRLREMEVFDKAVLLTHIHADGTGGLPLYQCPLNLLEVVLASSLSPGA
jgi:hypothetical protein